MSTTTKKWIKPKITLKLKPKFVEPKPEEKEEDKGEEVVSLWYYLPEELLLVIGKYLTYVTLSAIRLCSKQCLRVFSDVTLISLTSRQRRTIQKMCESDMYNYNRSSFEFDPKSVISCGVGTGKTVIALHAIHRFLNEKGLEKILICAPRMLFPVWQKAFKRWCQGLSELREFHTDTEVVKKKSVELCQIDGKLIVLTKNNIITSSVSSRSRCVTKFNFGRLNKHKSNNKKNLSNTEWLLWNLGSVKWDVIVCDDISKTPKFVRALSQNLTQNLKHNFRLFSLNASDRRQKNLVNYGHDDELPDKPKLMVNIYSFQRAKTKNELEAIYGKIRKILASSQSETKFGIYNGIPSWIPHRKIKGEDVSQHIFCDYKVLNGTAREKLALMEKFGKEYKSLYSGKTNALTKGHNMYPQEVNIVIRCMMGETSYYGGAPSLGLSNIYQALGRCHRPFSPYRNVVMNLFILYHHTYAIKKLKYFFGEYLVNLDDNLNTIVKRINGMRVGGRILKDKSKWVDTDSKKGVFDKANLIEIDDYLGSDKFERVEFGEVQEDGYYHNVIKLRE